MVYDEVYHNYFLMTIWGKTLYLPE